MAAAKNLSRQSDRGESVNFRTHHHFQQGHHTHTCTSHTCGTQYTCTSYTYMYIVYMAHHTHAVRTTHTHGMYMIHTTQTWYAICRLVGDAHGNPCRQQRGNKPGRKASGSVKFSHALVSPKKRGEVFRGVFSIRARCTKVFSPTARLGDVQQIVSLM